MAVFLLIFISCLVLGGGARQILLLHCHLAPFNQKANLFVVENNLPDRQTSLLPFLNPICKASLMKIFKTSRRNSGEIQSIGGNLIPTSGNPEISVFSFQKFSIPKVAWSRAITEAPEDSMEHEKSMRVRIRWHGIYSFPPQGLVYNLEQDT